MQFVAIDVEVLPEVADEDVAVIAQHPRLREIGEDAYQPGEHFSVDWFLYVRCVVVANGPAVFASVTSDPAEMPKDCEFEALLSVARMAYERKTAGEFDYVPQVSYETFSNKAGWKNG